MNINPATLDDFDFDDVCCPHCLCVTFDVIELPTATRKWFERSGGRARCVACGAEFRLELDET